jgi:hypothetical protein
MIPAGIEPSIAASEQPQTHALDRTPAKFHSVHSNWEQLFPAGNNW